MNVLIDLVGGPSSLARKSQLSRRVIDKYRAGESDPSRGRLIAMARGAGVSLLWLATGEGDMARTSGLPAGATPAQVAEYVALPKYDVQAAAGDGAVVVTEQISEWVYFQREWLRRELGVSARELVLIRAAGDSMAPTIENGDLLIVDVASKRWTRDGIYVIGVEDELWVKRVDRLPDGGLVLSSDNPRHVHGTATIAKAHISTVRFVGRVAWVGGRV